MPTINFTPNFNLSLETVHYNITYVLPNQPPQMTTPSVWMAFAFLGIGLLILSAMRKGAVVDDLSGVLATIFLFVSAIQAFYVDTVTSWGVTNNGPEFVLMETHTIYHYDFIGVLLGVCFVIGLANLYLLRMDYKRITEQETPQMDHASVQPRSAARDNKLKERDDE